MPCFRLGSLVCHDTCLSSGMPARAIHIDRPAKRNSLDPSTLAHLAQLIRSSPHAVLVLTASPPAFCAGFDLHALRQALQVPRGLERMTGMLYRVYTQLLRHPAPTLAIVDGPAIGGGAGLALCCDLVLATRRATFLLPDGPLRPLASIVLPLARRRNLPMEPGTPLSAEQAARQGGVDALLDELPRDAAPLDTLQAILQRHSGLLPRGPRRPLDRKSACRLLRQAFEPQATTALRMKLASI